ncbi:hypothetical protein F900_02148 [Acinetobacter modestus]|uniref:DUF551 domain-containing protein n=2 Tax=Acinetobacter modestus TaxID=1776740 RepID=N9NC95_9GAMM|nr:hypothetical protein F900_02148 [Acinetobacter modestus]
MFLLFLMKQQGAEMSNWISVSDQLPDDNNLVLAISITKCKYFNVYSVSSLDEFEDEEITHWMELPDAPKADTEET